MATDVGAWAAVDDGKGIQIARKARANECKARVPKADTGR